MDSLLLPFPFFLLFFFIIIAVAGGQGHQTGEITSGVLKSPRDMFGQQ
jgi:hypothetical protein